MEASFVTVVVGLDAGELEDFDKQLTMMFDLIALAFDADITRSVADFLPVRTIPA